MSERENTSVTATVQRLKELKSEYEAHLKLASLAAEPHHRKAAEVGAKVAAEMMELRKSCPHENVIYTQDTGVLYRCRCDDSHDATAGLCLDCGLFEGFCEEGDGFYILSSKGAKGVSFEEFLRLRSDLHRFLNDR